MKRTQQMVLMGKCRSTRTSMALEEDDAFLPRLSPKTLVELYLT